MEYELKLRKPEPPQERLLLSALERAVVAADRRVRVEENYPTEVEAYEHLVEIIGPEAAYEAVEFIAGLYRKAGITV